MRDNLCMMRFGDYPHSEMWRGVISHVEATVYQTGARQLVSKERDEGWLLLQHQMELRDEHADEVYNAESNNETNRHTTGYK